MDDDDDDVAAGVLAPLCLTAVSRFSRNLDCVALWTEGEGPIITCQIWCQGLRS